MLWRVLLAAVLGFGLLTIGIAGVAPSPGGSPFFGVALGGYPITPARLAEAAKTIRLTPTAVLFYLQWPATPQAQGFPQESLDSIWQQGAVPCLSWEPMYYLNGQEHVIDYERIVKGEYDRYLEEFAKKAKLWGKPLLIRFAHEMNLDRYHWGIPDKNRYGPRSPEIYQSLFRYVVQYFRKRGADNVLWVFCPNSESIPHPVRDQALWNQASNYYPGDAYVDVLGMDGYNWGTTQTVPRNGWQSQWRTFREISEPLYRELKALAPRKPIVVFEIASTDQGGDKRDWIKEAWGTAKAWDLKGLIWFQLQKEIDWNINSGTHYSYVAIIQGAENAPAWITALQKR
jgi:hypothetical protein